MSPRFALSDTAAAMNPKVVATRMTNPVFEFARARRDGGMVTGAILRMAQLRMQQAIKRS